MTRYFKIRGMDCAEEVAILKGEIGPLVSGEQNLTFDVLNARMVVTVPEDQVATAEIIKAVAGTGMTADVWREAKGDEPAVSFWSRNGQTILTVASGILGLLGFAFQVQASGSIAAAFGFAEQAGPVATPILAKLCFSLSILAGVWHFLPKAWYSLARFRPDMNLLMTVAIAGAVTIGEWSEAATVALLFSVSLLLESWSVGRARRAIAALMSLAPPTVRVAGKDGAEREVPPDQVNVGDLFLVRPGERIALDGVIAQGSSDVDQASITGESVPVSKSPGAEVYAGTINGDGALQVTSTKVTSDTTLARIIRMVGDSQSKRAQSEQWVETFARYYTPSVMVAALAVLVMPPLLLGGQWHVWFYNSLVLLVIACPCALVISTPVSIVAAIATAARQGVLIKGGVFVEVPAHLKAIALDKTGTLTEGKPAVVEVVPLNGHSEEELLQRAAAMESHSDHPLAVAIMRYAAEKKVVAAAAEEFQILQGKGATAKFEGRLFWLGSHRYLEERKQETPEIHERLEAMSSAGRSVVVIGNENHVCGMIALADQVRPATAQVITALRNHGIEHVIMLTGDNQATASKIAKATGIDEFRAELLPADKVNAIEELLKKYGQVAMVGDGVNDAPALGRATLGIAMGAVGSDAAIETADVALMSDDLSKVAWLIGHSRRALAIIRQNIFASLAIKVLFVVLTLAGFASLWAAIAADAGVSILVVLNGLRLLNGSPAKGG
ncbi:putative cadmium-transporting ATPase [Anatilimnocola aggregata]|uniref:P-type Zn(2+) transporter n=1 Tax=Anatilimnocola aggregata TaxID=2528021 RepID=A0A517Y8Z3_9BACT|nr:heavy metal translocating P-type ATPase [Anatilimnocola aggregata]QDU26709.1 putative cadmium-transporting ATPase [Anatilimnocola aggregata]